MAVLLDITARRDDGKSKLGVLGVKPEDAQKTIVAMVDIVQSGEVARTRRGKLTKPEKVKPGGA